LETKASPKISAFLMTGTHLYLSDMLSSGLRYSTIRDESGGTGGGAVCRTAHSQADIDTALGLLLSF
jgi:hypothetical protein